MPVWAGAASSASGQGMPHASRRPGAPAGRPPDAATSLSGGTSTGSASARAPSAPLPRGTPPRSSAPPPVPWSATPAEVNRITASVTLSSLPYSTASRPSARTAVSRSGAPASSSRILASGSTR